MTSRQITSGPFVLAIVLNWNQPEITIGCLNSLLKQEGVRLAILLVDNGSSVQCVRQIEAWAASRDIKLIDANAPSLQGIDSIKVALLRNMENLGYAGGMNAGLLRALDWGVEWAVLINNDVTLPPTLLRAMRETALEPGVGMVGCRVRNWVGSEMSSEYAGGRLMYELGVHLLWRRSYESVVASVNFIPGCVMMVKLEMLRTIGLFDETFFLYAEDVDLSYRAIRGGWKLRVNLTTYADHRLSTSMGGAHSAAYYYYVTRNTIAFIMTRLPVHIRIPSLAAFVAQTVIRGVQCLILRRWLTFRAIWQALIDVMRNRNGPAPTNARSPGR